MSDRSKTRAGTTNSKSNGKGAANARKPVNAVSTRGSNTRSKNDAACRGSKTAQSARNAVGGKPKSSERTKPAASKTTSGRKESKGFLGFPGGSSVPVDKSRKADGRSRGAKTQPSAKGRAKGAVNSKSASKAGSKPSRGNSDAKKPKGLLGIATGLFGLGREKSKRVDFSRGSKDASTSKDPVFQYLDATPDRYRMESHHVTEQMLPPRMPAGGEAGQEEVHTIPGTASPSSTRNPIGVPITSAAKGGPRS